MTKDIQVHRPEPIMGTGSPIATYDRNTDDERIIQLLESGQRVLISAFYSDGLELLKELHWHLAREMPNSTFKEQRAYRAAYRKLSDLVTITIVNHKLAVKKAPTIGWLAKLYPELDDFSLPFPEVQALNSAWQYHIKGVSIPTLRNKINPYYGVYFPIRFDHVTLFDNWLRRYKGPKKTAIEVGIGSGVHSLQLVKHGFQKVFGTDSNPNAIIGLTESMGTTKLSRKISLDHRHLFGKWKKPTELIVFNPPWLPNSRKPGGNDHAIFYDADLFPDFFEEAKERLLPDGKIVIIYSNLAQLTRKSTKHPIKLELDEGGRFQLELNINKKVKAPAGGSKRDLNWREGEEVELWVLIPI